MRKLSLKFGFIFVVVFLALSFFGSSFSRASAPALNPDPDNIPSNQKTALINCRYEFSNPGNQNPGLAQWVTTQDDKTSYESTVNEGDSSLALGFYVAAATCRPISRPSGDLGPGVVPDLRTQIASIGVSSSNGGSVTLQGIGDNTSLNPMLFSSISTTAYQELGSYLYTGIPFTIKPAGGFISNATYTITINFKAINHFENSGTWGCYVPAYSSSGQRLIPLSTNDFSKCGSVKQTYNIKVSVKPKVSIGGRVYNSTTNTGAAGVTVHLCGGGSAVTNSQGYWTKKINSKSSYCARVTSAVPAGWKGPTTRQNFSSLGHGQPDWSFHTSYEWQYSDAYCHRWADPGAAQPDGSNKYCPSSDNIADNDITASEQSMDFIYTSVPPTCGSFSTSPTVPESNQAFQYTMSANYANGPLAYFLTNVALKNAAGTNVATEPPLVGSAPDSHSFNSGGLSPGRYTASWTIASSVGAVDCNGAFTVGNQPYLKVYGNDVAVGDKFAGGSCNADGSRATVLTLGNKDRSGRSNTVYDYSGAGAQLAVFALGEIDQFFSAGQQSPSAGLGTSTVPTGLTFGNSNDGSSLVSGYGGRSAISHCATNYFDILTSGKPPTLSTNLISAPGDFTYLKNTGATPLHLSGATISSKKALVVDGDVYIDGNISYGPYSSVDTIPSFYLVVRGNIYIDKSVTNLSGVYVAQPNGDSKGTIYTCASGNSFVAASDLYDQCNKQLTINGAFIAKNVKFLRTNGTKKDSPANEPWNSSTIAEVFKSSPEMYLSAPAALTNVGGSTGSYDSISSLPPIF